MTVVLEGLTTFPITTRDLLSLAERQEALLRHPDCTPSARLEISRTMDDALEVATWMEETGRTELRHAGPFGPPLPKKGDCLVLKKGAEVSTTAPRKPGPAQRRRHVTVFDVFKGYVNQVHRTPEGRPQIVQPQVHWVGAGGYWCWSNIDNFE